MTSSKGFPGDWLCISFAFFLKVHEIIMERKVIFETVERSRLLHECSPRERIRNVNEQEDTHLVLLCTPDLEH